MGQLPEVVVPKRSWEVGFATLMNANMSALGSAVRCAFVDRSALVGRKHLALCFASDRLQYGLKLLQSPSCGPSVGDPGELRGFIE